LTGKKEKVASVFFKFDKDNDSYLNVAEFGTFLKTYVPTVTNDEMQILLSFFNPY